MLCVLCRPPLKCIILWSLLEFRNFVEKTSVRLDIIPANSGAAGTDITDKNWAVCLYPWSAASMTSGGARVVCLIFLHREACCFESSHDDCHHFREPFSRLEDYSCVIGVQHAPYRPSHARQRLLRLCSNYSSIAELDQTPYDGFVLAEAY